MCYSDKRKNLRYKAKVKAWNRCYIESRARNDCRLITEN